MAGKLGFGLMRLPQTDANNPAAIDIDQLKEMVDMFLEAGFTYFDTAWMYQDFASERAVKEALVERYPRESFTLATKLHPGFFDSLEDRDKIFYEQLEKTGAGFFDYYLLHGVDDESCVKFEELDCFSWMQAKKAEGLIRHAGFSFHGSPPVLGQLLDAHPETEFVQLQLNYLDWESPWIQSRACYEVCAHRGVPVIVMEPVKGGSLAKVPPEVEALFKNAAPNLSVPSWAVRFAATLPGVALVLSGMSDVAQMRDNISYMSDFQPLSQAEQDLCFKAADLINAQIAVPCTGCSYCTGSCPQNIPIPQYFSLYNEIMREDMEHKGWTISFAMYDSLAKEHGKASECIGCGSCEAMCPQHLPIIEHLRAVADRFE